MREVRLENEIYGHSRFCNTDFDDKLACLNLSGVWMGFYSRASMSSAPDEPPENIRLQRAFPFYRFLNRPVGRLYHQYQYSQNQM